METVRASVATCATDGAQSINGTAADAAASNKPCRLRGIGLNITCPPNGCARPLTYSRGRRPAERPPREIVNLEVATAAEAAHAASHTHAAAHAAHAAAHATHAAAHATHAATGTVELTNVEDVTKGTHEVNWINKC